jgi:polysaccharide export outer membrane protein
MKRPLPYLFVLATFLSLVPAPTSGQQTVPDTAVASQSPGASDANSLLPGDVVRIRIWREEDLSGEFQVDADGYVILPLLGSKRVVGVSPDKLREQLTDEYGDYLVNTSVNVTLLRRVVVLGEVRVPGQYTVDATQSVADLIARAQGLTPEGNANDIRLIRGGETFRADLNGSLSIVDAGIRSGDQIMVGKRSWFSRNFSSLVGVISIVANVVVIVRH